MYTNCQDKTAVAVVASLLLTFLTQLPVVMGFSSAPYSSDPPPFSIRKVVIDAGHGGKDPGCLGSHTQEKHIALNIALLLGEEIARVYPEIEVIYTRTEDVFIPLHERARIANREQADLFISIHCNYIGKRNRAEGTETYIMGLHRAKENLDVAKRENSAILHEDDYAEHYDGYDPDSPEGHILLSMYQNAHLEQSIALAHAIETEFSNGSNRHSRGVKQAGFLVLRKTTMPSVLVETGFLSTDNDEEFLSSEHGQKETALSIFKAFTNYKTQIEQGSGIRDVIVSADPQEISETPEVETVSDYYVQLLATKEPLTATSALLAGVPNLQTRRDHEYYKYLAGPYTDLPSAVEARSQLQESGFNEAFVVAYRNGQRVQLNADRTVTHE